MKTEPTVIFFFFLFRCERKAERKETKNRIYEKEWCQGVQKKIMVD